MAKKAKVGVYVNLEVGRDDDIIAFYRAISREWSGNVQKELIEALRRGIESPETQVDTPQAIDSELRDLLHRLPDEARLRSIFEAALAGVVIGQVEKEASGDEDFGASLLDELTLD